MHVDFINPPVFPEQDGFACRLWIPLPSSFYELHMNPIAGARGMARVTWSCHLYATGPDETGSVHTRTWNTSQRMYARLMARIQALHELHDDNNDSAADMLDGAPDGEIVCAPHAGRRFWIRVSGDAVYDQSLTRERARIMTFLDRACRGTRLQLFLAAYL